MTSFITVINLLFNALYVLILARIVLSFLNLSPDHPVNRFVYDLTEPLLAPVRRLLPPTGVFDLSPLLVLIGAGVLRSLIVNVLI